MDSLCRTPDISWIVKMRFGIRYLHAVMQVAVITEAVAFVGLVLRVVRVVADELMIGVCLTRRYLFLVDHKQLGLLPKQSVGKEQ